MRNAKDPIDREGLEPAKVGGPIDAVKGDASAHVSNQDAKTRKEAEQIKATEMKTNPILNTQNARKEAGLAADGNLDPNFEGTQPRLMADGTLAVVGMQDLKEAAAEFDGETVREQEIAAGLVVDQSVPDHSKKDEVEEEVEDGEGMTVAELKEALDGAGVEYSSSDRKADLQKLYADNIG